MDMSEIRSGMLEILSAAIAAVVPRSSVRQRLEEEALNGGKVAIIAIGKAAAVMMESARTHFGERVADALLITSPAYAGSIPANVRYVPGNHPLPDQTSLDAGSALLDFLSVQDSDTRLVFLISGGASAMVDVLEPHVSLEQMQEANRWMLANGLDIHQTNLVRKCLAAIKGGKLLTHFDNDALVLLVSDVPGDNPRDIGSGLLVPDPDVRDVQKIELPAWLSELVHIPQEIEPRPNVHVEIIASNEIAKTAAAAAAKKQGLPVTIHPGCLCGETTGVSRRIADFLLREAPSGIHIWGGETSVNLPPEPGTGGRNQQLALQVAHQLVGNDSFCFVSAGTDGIDGHSEDAGAIVDGGTMMRGETQGLDIEDSLARADANPFLAASGDLIHLGATGTNVMDIMLAWKGDS
jgi:hydroxypyruvate reductase